MWKKLIPNVCKALENAGIRYHADASSSVYVNGFEFDMDDFDVTVEWGFIEIAKHVFSEYSPSDITGDIPKRFQFTLYDHNVDVMAYKSDTGIGPESERVCIEFSGTMVWSKKPCFYLQRMRENHPIKAAAAEYFRENSK